MVITLDLTEEETDVTVRVGALYSKIDDILLEWGGGQAMINWAVDTESLLLLESQTR